MLQASYKTHTQKLRSLTKSKIIPKEIILNALTQLIKKKSIKENMNSVTCNFLFLYIYLYDVSFCAIH